MTVVFVKCRCGSTHQVPGQPKPCTICRADTWDFHKVCARCRGAEASLERAARAGAAP